ncbi:MAG TPA: sigma-54 dependent transcriptional regulator [Syntrophorhabdus sp.]|jgi:DNA-binding NtrC family response regulator|nr:sigma-54-dependent Fis family transcriptional regulator [Syntrophorhabdus sp.]MDI9557969.1 sigma-54 dependent transcriptional regulator [Pseudomonadota bacterium]OPX95077.1 MAG: Transcriptional regulatory protein ZraR [Syntrophorhabdus sp. PtaB.Bin027]OQB78115.1 MAG: Transcriptional regulatory protein ZraR [Deltaproteobacteria bacterium ADurb.Bin135]MBP8744189.1 sigma-54-dependent Fis family transcriptional regulator [Syntrophorhabdus sp.]
MRHDKGSVLVVEDDRYQREIIKTILAKEGFYVETTDTGKKAIDSLKSGTFDVILTDLRLPDIDGTEVLKEAKSFNRPNHVIIITAYGSIPSAIEATKLGAFYYLEKPFEKDQLLLVINNAVNQVKLLNDNIMLKDQLAGRFHLDNIIGVHGRMEELFKVVGKVAPTNSTVLIYGESGTGKELFAKSIHYNSPRKNKLFFAINCAAIPETLLESELFGYEKGAFTGALARHTGLFEQANGSTLFLDEIGDLTLGTQAKLLRVIQERELRRIGGKENIKLDVRIITATNKNLEQEMAAGKFRQDLYYRLNVIAFTIPPLRERLTDVPILAEHFLKRLNASHEDKKHISQDVLNALLVYTWPGNVRQLESVIERAYVMCDGETINLEHIPEEVKQSSLAGPLLRELQTNFDSLIDAKLTGAEYRLYLYLSRLNPFDENFQQRMEPKSIIERLGINRDTFFVGIAKLKELGLYDFKAKASQAKTISPNKSQKRNLQEIPD